MNKTLSTDGDYATVHKRRFDLSLHALKQIGLQAGMRVLEVGGDGPFTNMLRQFVGPTIATIGGDDGIHNVAHVWSHTVASEFDFVLCMEVLEHLKDTPVAPRDYWTHDGVINCLRGCYTALKLGGKLFVSTPNVCGYKSIFNLLNEQHPFAYPPHVREMSVWDLRAHLNNTGFSGPTIWTVNVWDNHGLREDDKRIVERLLYNTGCNTLSRDDCIFAYAVR